MRIRASRHCYRDNCTMIDHPTFSSIAHFGHALNWGAHGESKQRAPRVLTEMNAGTRVVSVHNMLKFMDSLRLDILCSDTGLVS